MLANYFNSLVLECNINQSTINNAVAIIGDFSVAFCFDLKCKINQFNFCNCNIILFNNSLKLLIELPGLLICCVFVKFNIKISLDGDASELFRNKIRAKQANYQCIFWWSPTCVYHYYFHLTIIFNLITQVTTLNETN